MRKVFFAGVLVLAFAIWVLPAGAQQNPYTERPTNVRGNVEERDPNVKSVSRGATDPRVAGTRFAVTGSDVVGLAVLGVAVLGTGAALTRASRRSRATEATTAE